MEKESSKRIRELPFWTHTGPSVVRVSISWIENCLIHQLLGRTLRRSWLRNGESLDCDLMSSNISWKQKLKRIKLFPHLWFRKKFSHISVQFSSVTQSCPTLCDPMNCSTPGLPVQNQLPESTQTHVIESVMPSNHLILCPPLLLLPSIFPSIRVFSNESVLRIRWPKYWSFSFSISPSNEYSGLISFKMYWLDLCPKDSQESSPTPPV